MTPALQRPEQRATYKGVAYTADGFHKGERPGWAKVPEDSPTYRVGYRWVIRATQGSLVTPGAIGSLKSDVHEVVEHEDEWGAPR